jgi:membrane protease YdiL (CAAX protease family)
MSAVSVPAPRAQRGATLRLWAALIFFLVVSALASLLLSMVQGSLKLNSNVTVLTQFSTAIGALVTWIVWRKRLVFPAVSVRGWARPLAAAIVLAAVIGLILFVTEIAESHRWPLLNPSTLGAPLLLVVIAQLIGAAGEELGWRGVVQPLLETRVRMLPAAIITGLLFGVGHFYVISAGIEIYALFIVSAIGLSLLLGYLTTGRSIWQRVAIASVVHWLVNMVFLVGFSGGDESALWTANTAIATGLTGIGYVIFIRVRVSRLEALTSALARSN